jgi:hypothetical protein
VTNPSQCGDATLGSRKKNRRCETNHLGSVSPAINMLICHAWYRDRPVCLPPAFVVHKRLRRDEHYATVKLLFLVFQFLSLLFVQLA